MGKVGFSYVLRLTLRSLSRDQEHGNENGKKAIGKQYINLARASPFLCVYIPLLGGIIKINYIVYNCMYSCV